MTGIGILLIGILLFFSLHSISIVNEPWRDGMAAKLGEWPWRGLYSVLSILGLGLIIWGYGMARLDPVVIYHSPQWMRHLTMLLMLPVFPLLIATYLPGRIQSHTKHPMLVATMLWGTAHLLVNGALGDLVLFSSFLLWAIADRISMAKRQQRPLPLTLRSKLNDGLALVFGLLIYVGFVFWVHSHLIGVPILNRAA